MYPKDTEKWKQFTTKLTSRLKTAMLLCIPKILKNESNSQQLPYKSPHTYSCCVSQRYWKMKAIHNRPEFIDIQKNVVVYPKDTEKWKQFTTPLQMVIYDLKLLCIPKILKNESNSQQPFAKFCILIGCCVSQRYWKMKAIHNWTMNNLLNQ